MEVELPVAYFPIGVLDTPEGASDLRLKIFNFNIGNNNNNSNIKLIRQFVRNFYRKK